MGNEPTTQPVMTQSHAYVTMLLLAYTYVYISIICISVDIDVSIEDKASMFEKKRCQPTSIFIKKINN